VTDSTLVAPAEPTADVAAPSRDVARTLFFVTAGLAVLSIVVAIVNAVHRGWVPIGDDALFAIRSRDVFTRHIPLLGTWTSASLAAKIDINNPGAVMFDLLAVPTTLFGSGSAGVAIGAAAINVGSALGFGVIAYRRGGAAIGAIAMAVVAVLAWTMGGAVLVDPVQTASMLLPFLFFLGLIWALCCEELWAIPWLALVGSVLVQTYVTYVYFVPALVVWAAICLFLQMRAHHARPDRLVRMLVLAGIVLVVCWTQTVWEQLTGRGAGNISRSLRSLRRAPPTLGANSGTRIVAQVMTRPPWWFRPSFREFLAKGPNDTVSIAFAAVSLVVLLAALTWLALATRRRADHDSSFAVVTAIVAVLAALFTAARIPTGALGVTAHTFRWLWPIAAFMWFAVLVAVARRFVVSRVAAQRVAAVCLAIAAVFLVLNVPWTDQGASAQQADMPVVHDLAGQLARARIPRQVVFDFRGENFADPFGTAVLVQLQRNGVGFITPDPGMLYQIGWDRRYNGANAQAGIVLREGDDVRNAPAGSRLLAQHLGLNAAERSELDGLISQLTAYVQAHGLTLNDRGAAAVRHGDQVPFTADQVQDPGSLFGSRVLEPFALAGDLQVDANTAKQFTRYAELQRRWDEQTVAVYLTPVSAVVAGA
jgi:hypothetical protein